MVQMNHETLRAVVAGRADLPIGELADQLASLGYDVVARVDGGREAVDAVRRLAPDAVVLDTHLADGLGVLVAQVVTRAAPGLAALVLSEHPAVADRNARPRWGAVSVLPSCADVAELDLEIRDAVKRARALAEVDVDVDAVPPTRVAAPVDEALIDEALVDEALVDEALVDEALIDEALIDEALIGEVSEGDSGAGDDVSDDASLLAGHRSIVERAIDAVATRTGMSAGDVLQLMEQEADESGQTLLDVAQSMLVEETVAA
jgi:AmiR/NasT family two-component response regulator